jgi:hypothetical protein
MKAVHNQLQFSTTSGAGRTARADHIPGGHAAGATH